VYCRPGWTDLWRSRYDDRFCGDEEDVCTGVASDTQLALLRTIARAGRRTALRQRGLEAPLRRLLVALQADPAPRVDWRAGVYLRRFPDKVAVQRALDDLDRDD
jgi:hypothetical protein